MDSFVPAGVACAFEKLPPHSTEAEMCLLASMMLDRSVIPQVLALVDRDALYDTEHQTIFDVVVHLYHRRSAIDAVLVREELHRRQLLDEVGGTAYLAKILATVPSAAHATHYAGVVREKALLRQIIDLSNSAIRAAYAPAQEDVAVQILSDYAAKASRIAAGGRGDEVHRLDRVAREVLARRETGEVLRIPTGITELDRVTGGLRKGAKMIVGARPGMGKSVLLKQIGWNVVRSGVPFGLITVEESRHKVAENMLANEATVPNNRVAFGTAAQEEQAELDDAVRRLDGQPFYIVDSARKLGRIVPMAHLLACRYGCKVIAVDHLHLIDGEPERNENREREISKISGELKWTWKDLNVCGIEAAQLNRGGGRERPTLASLRDSGSLEQDGDVVLLLHREDYYRRTEGGQFDNVLEVIVAKNKDGATGTVPVYFDEARQRVADLEPEIPSFG